MVLKTFGLLANDNKSPSALIFDEGYRVDIIHNDMDKLFINLYVVNIPKCSVSA